MALDERQILSLALCELQNRKQRVINRADWYAEGIAAVKVADMDRHMREILERLEKMEAERMARWKEHGGMITAKNVYDDDDEPTTHTLMF